MVNPNNLMHDPQVTDEGTSVATSNTARLDAAVAWARETADSWDDLGADQDTPEPYVRVPRAPGDVGREIKWSRRYPESS